MSPPPPDGDLLQRARTGDERAFDLLVQRHGGAARRAVRRLVGHPEEVEDLLQDALLKAWRGLDRFRGDSAFGTWLVQIASRTALDHLRRKRRWRAEAQALFAQACRRDEALAAEVLGAVAAPGFGYDAREHIAFCFGCVARTLRPEIQVALVLRDVVGMRIGDAARAAGMSRGALRAAVAAGRRDLTDRFEGLCALVNKEGVCWQCEGLRAAMPEPLKGPPAPPIRGATPEARYAARAALARAATADAGVSQALHDVFAHAIDRQEEAGAGTLDVEAAAACRPGG